MPAAPDPRLDQMFPRLSPEEIDRLRRFGTMRRYTAGDPVVTTGEVDSGMFVLISGTVAVSARGGLGHVIPIIELGPGGFLAESRHAGGPAPPRGRPRHERHRRARRPRRPATLVDVNGRIRFHHFGEGAYEQTERAIQTLLSEGGRTIDNQLVGVSPRGLEVSAEFGSLRSPESYLGYEQSERFASPGDALVDVPRVYTVPPRLALNQWALAGDWTVKAGAVVMNAANGKIVYRFHARDVNLVMGPKRGMLPVRFAVKIDGTPPGAAHGTDIDEQGKGTAARQRTYQLVRQQKAMADREFEIQCVEPGVEAFCFTFG